MSEYFNTEHNIATITANFPEYDELLGFFIHTLKLKKHDIYIAGGAIRDALLGRQPKDVDIFICTDYIYERSAIIKALSGFNEIQILPNYYHDETHEYSNIDLLINGKKIQLMNDCVNNTLPSLISRFDYNICQYGYYKCSDEVITTEGAKVLMSALQVMEVSPLDFLDPNKYPELQLCNVTDHIRSLKRGAIFEYRYKVKLTELTFNYLLKSVQGDDSIPF